MGNVKTLRADVYKKIAAGEVVERPLSVVKELVENAIDAGADDINIELMEGGKRLIRITDNGSGFHPDDMETAFKNHSTSKISELVDFNSLCTLGFRGEALPSILEVSRIELKTSDNTGGHGWRCLFEEGKLLEKEQIACKKGSSITVNELFYNFPVRRKFLKSDRTELNQILAFLEPISLVNHHISFQLTHNNRTVFMYKKAENLEERIYQLFGKDFLNGLQETEFHWENYGLTGFISRINSGVPVKKHQYYFVNGRPVREKTLIASFNNSFKVFLEKSRNPVGILLMTIPAEEVDVNIHPMKLEIKFVDSSKIYRFIKHAVEQSFSESEGFSMPAPSSSASSYPAGSDGGGSGGWSGGSGGGMPRTTRPDNPALDFRDSRGGYGGGFDSRPGPQDPRDALDQAPGDDFAQAQMFAGHNLDEEDFVLIGQYKNSYILVEKNEELLIIDQHNAQERVNFDKLKKQYQENGVSSINPLFPLIVELSPSEAAKLTSEKMELLDKAGFRLEPLMGHSYDIKSFPQVLGERSVKDAIMEIIHMAEDQVNFEDKVLAEVACKSAIKVNHKLYPDQMKTIVKNLFLTGNPYFCPHKRPIIIDLTLEEIEKRLKRK